jgi:hypothetical protein
LFPATSCINIIQRGRFRTMTISRKIMKIVLHRFHQCLLICEVTIALKNINMCHEEPDEMSVKASTDGRI